MYNIKKRTYDIARANNLIVQPSHHKNKKIDVYDLNNKYICSIGSIDYLDYPYYIDVMGKEYANKRRKLYIIRHKKDINKFGSKGYYSYLLLWT